MSKETIGLGNADNTADVDKPLSTAQAAAIYSAVASHAGLTNNPHAVTKAQVGLEHVDNTSDADKPVSAAVQAALNGKQNAFGYTPANKAGETFTGRVSVPAGTASSQGLAIGGTLIGEVSDILRIRPPGNRVRYETQSGTPYFDVDANTGIANLFGNREVVNSTTFANYLPGNIANMSAGSLGTYAMAVNPSGGNIAFGDTVSGSNIAASNSWGAGSGSLSGSWRCMGRTVASNTPDRTTLWLRIS